MGRNRPVEAMPFDDMVQRYCWGVRVVAGVGRRTWCCRGRRAAASGFKREMFSVEVRTKGFYIDIQICHFIIVVVIVVIVI